ncbi:MAG: InlB B-repeat-containing protein, partial [Bacilli bacterium]|nr:InlB B-repeat-containing protein [Bacilli bacterium]
EVTLDSENISSSAISSNGKIVTFESDKLKQLGDATNLEYEVTNASRQFDANVAVECNSENVSSGDASLKDINEYLDIEYPDNGTIIKAREKGNGTIRVTLKRATLEQFNVGISCKLVVDVIEREDLAEDNPDFGGDFGDEVTKHGVSGYVVNADNQILPNVNLVIYSATPNYVTTNAEGYFEIDTLSLGSHEAYLMLGYSIDQLKSMKKSEHISNATSKAEFTTSSKTIVFDNNYKIVDKVVSDASCVVSFNANGGIVAPANKTIKYGDAYGELPTPKLTGYKFVGWFTGADFKNQVTADKKLYATGTQTLYAKWDIGNYKVTLDSAGGEKFDALTKKYGEEYGTLPTPTRENYIFKGWYFDNNLITSTTKVNKDEDHTLVAKWEEKKTTIIVEVDGKPTEKEVSLNKPVLDELGEPKKEGYEFEGWYLDEDCTIPVTEDTKIPEDGNIKFYPKYEASEYTITFNAEGGAVEPSTKSVTFNQAYGDLPIPTKEGYKFLGWFIGDNRIVATSIV